MLRVEDADPENLLRCSFHQYQQEQAAPALENQAEEFVALANAVVLSLPTISSTSSSTNMTGITEAMVNEYYLWTKQLLKTKSEMNQIIMKPQNCLPFLNPGRLMKISAFGVDWGWGVLINHRKATGSDISGFAIGFENHKIPSDSYILDIMLCITDSSVKSNDNSETNDKTKSGELFDIMEKMSYKIITLSGVHNMYLACQ
jgi:ATP-dependent RNA helicase DOB1